VREGPSIPMIVGDAPHLCVLCVGPGERLSTMGRPVLRMASAICRISVER
jgi:hypothetical protein